METAILGSAIAFLPCSSELKKPMSWIGPQGSIQQFKKRRISHEEFERRSKFKNPTGRYRRSLDCG
jgi:hypothetical protein